LAQPSLLRSDLRWAKYAQPALRSERAIAHGVAMQSARRMPKPKILESQLLPQFAVAWLRGAESFAALPLQPRLRFA
jgi:hypothetical protein